MALEGTLRDFSLADILQLIGLQRKSGVLTLKREGDVVTVSFVEGSVVAADSLHRPLDDRLGAVLVKSGKLTEARLQEALAHQRRTLQRLGFVLLQKKFINEDTLRRALETQITQIIYRLFRWNDGDYHFSQEDEIDYDRELIRPLSAESVLMEGARMVDEWPILERRIPSFTLVFHAAALGQRIQQDGVESVYEEDIDFDLLGEDGKAGGGETVRLTPEEALILSLIDGRRSVQEVIDSNDLGEFDTCRVLAQLLDRELIHLPAAPKEEAAAVERRRIPLATTLSVVLGLVALVSAGLAALQFGGLALGRAVVQHPGHPSGTLAATVGVPKVRLAVSRTRLQRIDRAIHAGSLIKLAQVPDLVASADLDRLLPPLPGPDHQAFESLVDPDLAAAVGYGTALLRPRDLVDPWGRRYDGYDRGWTGRGETPYYVLQGRGAAGAEDNRLLIRRELWELRPDDAVPFSNP